MPTSHSIRSIDPSFDFEGLAKKPYQGRWIYMKESELVTLPNLTSSQNRMEYKGGRTYKRMVLSPLFTFFGKSCPAYASHVSFSWLKTNRTKKRWWVMGGWVRVVCVCFRAHERAWREAVDTSSRLSSDAINDDDWRTSARRPPSRSFNASRHCSLLSSSPSFCFWNCDNNEGGKISARYRLSDF